MPSGNKYAGIELSNDDAQLLVCKIQTICEEIRISATTAMCCHRGQDSDDCPPSLFLQKFFLQNSRLAPPTDENSTLWHAGKQAPVRRRLQACTAPG